MRGEDGAARKLSEMELTPSLTSRKARSDSPSYDASPAKGKEHSVQAFVRELEGVSAPGHVKACNVWVLCCEGRQSANKWGTRKLRALLAFARASLKEEGSGLTKALAAKKEELVAGGGTSL